MTEEKKMIWMYQQAHSISEQAIQNLSLIEEDDEATLCYVKNGHVCWRMTKAELVFDYLTKDL